MFSTNERNDDLATAETLLARFQFEAQTGFASVPRVALSKLTNREVKAFIKALTKMLAK
jgi:hypothetical protein